jgi:hypothetical protein
MKVLLLLMLVTLHGYATSASEHPSDHADEEFSEKRAFHDQLQKKLPREQYQQPFNPKTVTAPKKPSLSSFGRPIQQTPVKQQPTPDQSCVGIDSKCENNLFRVCTKINDEDRYSPSCVEKKQISGLLKTGSLLAGTTFKGKYYDCHCEGIRVMEMETSKNSRDTKTSSPKTNTIPVKAKPDKPDPRINLGNKVSIGEWDDCEDCPPEEIELTIVEYATCNVVRQSLGVYTVTAAMTVLNGEPSAPVIELESYNDNIRQRGTCSNRMTDLNGEWDFDSDLWVPASNINSPKWAVTDIDQEGDLVTIGYAAEFTLQELGECENYMGEGGFISQSEDLRTFEGNWHLSKVVPVDINDENAGEMVQYDRTCHFQIHQGGDGLDTLCYVSRKLDVTVQWTRSFCTESGRIGFGLTTCVAKENTDQGYLYQPTVLSTASVPEGTFEIDPDSEPDACYYNHDESRCCQDWDVTGISPDAEPPFIDSINIHFLYGLNDEENPHLDHEVTIIINAYMLDDCDALNDIDIDDIIEGHVQLYRDPDYQHEYECCESFPFIDCHRAYAALLLAIDPDVCHEFLGTITNITLVYYEEGEYDDTELASVLIYDYENENLPETELFDVMIETDENMPCEPRISWYLKKRYSAGAKIKAIVGWKATHVPYENMYPVAPPIANYHSASGLYEVGYSRFAPTLNAKPSHGYGSKLQLHRGTHSQLKHLFPHVTQFYRPGNNGIREKNSVYSYGRLLSHGKQELQANNKKLEILTDDLKLARYHFSSKLDTSAMEISCPEYSEWDHDAHECSSVGSWYFWFPGGRHRSGESSVVFWFFMVFLFISVGVCIFVAVTKSSYWSSKVHASNPADVHHHNHHHTTKNYRF